MWGNSLENYGDSSVSSFRPQNIRDLTEEGKAFVMVMAHGGLAGKVIIILGESVYSLSLRDYNIHMEIALGKRNNRGKLIFIHKPLFKSFSSFFFFTFS